MSILKRNRKQEAPQPTREKREQEVLRQVTSTPGTYIASNILETSHTGNFRSGYTIQSVIASIDGVTACGPVNFQRLIIRTSTKPGIQLEIRESFLEPAILSVPEGVVRIDGVPYRVNGKEALITQYAGQGPQHMLQRGRDVIEWR